MILRGSRCVLQDGLIVGLQRRFIGVVFAMALDFEDLFSVSAFVYIEIDSR